MSEDKDKEKIETSPNKPTIPQFPTDRVELNDIGAPKFPNDRIEKGEKLEDFIKKISK